MQNYNPHIYTPEMREKLRMMEPELDCSAIQPISESQMMAIDLVQEAVGTRGEQRRYQTLLVRNGYVDASYYQSFIIPED